VSEFVELVGLLLLDRVFTLQAELTESRFCVRSERIGVALCLESHELGIGPVHFPGAPTHEIVAGLDRRIGNRSFPVTCRGAKPVFHPLTEFRYTDRKLCRTIKNIIPIRE